MNSRAFKIQALILGIVFLCLSTTNTIGQGIAYHWHKGSATLKTDLVIDGEFKYRYSKSDLPQFAVKDREVEGTRQIDVSMFRKLVLEGAERGVSSRKDTTIFVWVEQYEDLLRVVREGKINAYDNSKIIDEEYNGLDAYILVAERPDFGIKTIKKVGDLTKVMSDKPYFMRSAKATGRAESRDFRVVVFLIDLFNDKQPMQTLRWPQAQLETNRGEKLQGQAYIQPLDLRNEFNTNEYAFIHFYDEKNGFRLFRNDQVKEVKIDGKIYEQGFYGLTNKNFFGQKWFHEGDEYLVTRKIVNRNNYFYLNRDNNEQDYIVLKQVSGTYLKPEEEGFLRQKYFQENELD